ncbi:TerB family tellurite resistance protein [Ekhidna sp. To15]|uniref:TerB family tellurite resistance protein n=1 Tax=Ekhidna sp. To15 TaxID=3395267 RepID=UPI003F5246EB
MSIKAKLSVLVQLANIDGDFAGEERDLIYMIGKANGIGADEINNMVENPEPLPPLSTMSEDDKFEYLFHLVQLMKIDSQVYLSEIKFCEELAEKLGFKRNVISELSARIYSDPAIASDVASLKREVRKHRN